MGNNLNKLRVVGFLEGISFLLLLFMAMPMKYIFGSPLAVKYIGMAHGVLFIGYVILLLWVHVEHQWSWRKSILAFICSLIPFGMFYADRKLFRE